MSLLPYSACRLLLATGLVICALTACGRRGTLEPPPDPALAAQPARQVQGQTVDDEGEELRDQVVPSPTPTPPRRRQRGYTIPKEPFILDPLL
jgi:predicted small lipoprotein YifL